jgi:nucleoside-diphosphate-sugar epimerase
VVTGGAGFIGSHLVEALERQGCRVVVVDDLSSGHLANLEAVMDRIEFVNGDIRDPQTLNDAARGCAAIFHLAAVVSVPRTVAQPLASAQVNEVGTLNVFEAARRNRVGRVVFASSSAVYGDDPQLPKHEDMLPVPLSPYAVQKIAGEYYGRVYHRLHGTKTAALRFFNVFGPRQDPSSPYSGVISIFMSRAVSRQAPTIFGDGEQSRDFVYVSDVVEALMLAARWVDADGRPLNVGSGRPVTVNRLWQKISDLVPYDGKPEYAPQRVGDIRQSLADVSRAASAVGFVAKVDFDAGLARTFEWYQSPH